MTYYDWFLLAGVLYTAVGSDLLLNWGAGLITGRRITPGGANPLDRLFYLIHAKGDPNMRSTAPVNGPLERIPAWNHALAVGNGTIVLAMEALIVIGFIVMARSGSVPDFARLAAFVWLMRSVWGEISYWHVLTEGDIEPLRGLRLAWYWLIGMPQALFPFLVAERFYPLDSYSFTPLRFAAFVAVPIALMIVMKVTYRRSVTSAEE